MRHATVNAIREILDLPALEHEMTNVGGEVRDFIAACDFRAHETPLWRNWFCAHHAFQLCCDGEDCALPTCPGCADLVDLALVIRAETQQAAFDAEREAERKRGAA